MYQTDVTVIPIKLINMLFQETKNLFFHILAVYVRTGVCAYMHATFLS